MVRLCGVGMSGCVWQFPANILCGTLSQVRTGDFFHALGRLGHRTGPSAFSFTLQRAFRHPCGICPLVPSDAFRHACHLHGDEVVLVSESQVDLQAGLNARHAWGFRSRSTFGIGPTKSAVMIFGPAQSRPDCRVHLGGVPLLL